jgi:hypothetical protein
LVDAISSDLVEGVEQRLRNLKRDQQRNRGNLPLFDTAVFLPAWLRGPKAEPRTPVNYQLAEA